MKSWFGGNAEISNEWIDSRRDEGVKMEELAESYQNTEKD